MPRARSSADISIAYLAVLQVGFTPWMAYGVSLGNVAIIAPNSVAFVVGAATLAIALHPELCRERTRLRAVLSR